MDDPQTHRVTDETLNVLAVKRNDGRSVSGRHVKDRHPLAIMLGVLVLAGVMIGCPKAFAGSTVGDFEIDGNLVDSPAGGPIDWSTDPEGNIPHPGLPNRVDFKDASGSGDGIFGQTARLSLADAQARAGQYEQAINTFKELAQRKDGPLPIDGILMHLGRTYLDAGKRAEAQQTFNRLVEEFPTSPYTAEARQQLDSLKKT